jgi:cell wall-associated NlpC family hydrolase
VAGVVNVDRVKKGGHGGSKGRAVAAAALLAGATLLGSVGPVSASPISDKRAEARRLQGRIDSTGSRIAALGERYNGTVLAVEQAGRAIAESERRLEAAQGQWELARAALRKRAADLYISVSHENPLRDVDVGTVTDLMSRSRYSAAVQDRDRELFATISATRQDMQVRRRDRQAARAKAEHQRDTLRRTRAQLESENTRLADLLKGVKGDLARLVAEERARQEAAARARAVAEAARLAAANRRGRAATGRATWIGPDTPIPDVPAPSKGAAAAVAYARAQLGKPYVFYTAGPETFDCSGLTMKAWQMGGVSMPHYSGAQFAMFPHVPLRALQPGDLVFHGPGGADHVAIYVGNGMQIAATHTGSYVLLQPVDYPKLSGAVRPGPRAGQA